MSNRAQRTQEKKAASRESARLKGSQDSEFDKVIAGIDKELFDIEKRLEALEKKS